MYTPGPILPYCLAVPLLLLGGMPVAQSKPMQLSCEADVMRAVLVSIVKKADAGGGRVTLDPRPMLIQPTPPPDVYGIMDSDRGMGEERTTACLAKIINGIGVTVMGKDAHLQGMCDYRDRHCKPSSKTTSISLSEPVLADGMAKVIVRTIIIEPGQDRARGGEDIYFLDRSTGQWRVTRTLTMEVY